MSFRVLHHNNCFDGACSAALFAKFYRECVGGGDDFEFVGLAHQPGGVMSDSIFGAGQNAVVDFKYSMSPKLTWWFDHHESAFLTPEMRADFDAGQLTEKRFRRFFDPSYISCTSLIADVGRNHFGWKPAGLEDLLYWADIIDGARFASAEAAVEMREPAMKIAMVIENAEETDFIPRIIRLLTTMSFSEILAQPFVQERVAPLWDKHEQTKELIRQRARFESGVVYVEILDLEIDALNKFVPYYFYPDATYTIAVTRSKARTKVSVGTNPWTTRTPDELVNLSEVCERYGGGGHARVGAISLRADEGSRGREIALEIVQYLRAGEQR